MFYTVNVDSHLTLTLPLTLPRTLTLTLTLPRRDNPGVWVLHCHVDSHLEMGMRVAFVESEDDM